MEIKYEKSGNGTVIGIGDYSDCGDCPHGIAPELWEAVKSANNLFTSGEHEQLRNTTNLRAYARAAEGDEPDEEIGKSVVREKLVVRDGLRYRDKLLLAKRYLESQLAGVEEKISSNDLRVERARYRLAKMRRGE